MLLLKTTMIKLVFLCLAAGAHGCIDIPRFGAVTCQDGVRNGDETDVDCGGPCQACAAPNSLCEVPGDCDSQVCVDGQCQLPRCEDQIQNGDETGVDCGGACEVCALSAPGDPCEMGGDCDSGNCVDALCVAATCEDEVQNGDETGVDCGGMCQGCPPSGPGEPCEIGGDCDSTICADNVCLPARCDDGLRNATETDVDCGGECDQGCPLDGSCILPEDCATRGACIGGSPLMPVTYGRCAAANCDDLIRNQDETDVDCGGVCPLRCSLNQGCLTNDDCDSGSCQMEDGMPLGTCAAPNCSDGLQNGDETFVDCGGSCEQGCLPRHPCNEDADCNTGLTCDSLQCVASHCTDGTHNASETDYDCGGPNCVECGDRRMCSTVDDCRDDLICTNAATPATSFCLDETCVDGEQGGSETDVDCGGNQCLLCGPDRRCRSGFDCISSRCLRDDGSALPDDNDTPERGACADFCRNNIRDGDETGTDCGGPTCVNRCGPGGSCRESADCAPGNICQREDAVEFGSCLPGGG